MLGLWRQIYGYYYKALIKATRSVQCFFVLSNDDPDLIKSQFAAFTKQLPVLYLVLIANVVLTCITHFHSAPLWMSAWAPGFLCSLALMRMISWIYRRGQEITVAEATQRLRATIFIGPVLSLVFTGWGLCLFPYGGAYAQCQVAFFISMTLIGCIFCLAPVRPAALLSISAVIIPFAAFFMQTRNIALVAMGMNVIAAAAGMIFILFGHYNNFAKLVESQKSLLLKNTETQRLSDENIWIANRDSLTDLPNRRSFIFELKSLLEQARTSGSSFAVGLIDLDGFKAVNDLYGHSAGDRVLVEATRRLQNHASDTILFARLGGDEFGLIVNCGISEPALMSFAQRICLSLGEPYILPGSTVELSGSVGLAIFPEAGTTVDTLFERADYALYHAKQNLRGAAIIFSDEHETKIRRLALLEQELRQCDLNCEMSLVYQPIYNVTSGQTIAFEALARWTSPAYGVVSPEVFIPLAERSGLINRLTKTLLKQAFTAMRTWPSHVGISFNLSARDLASTDAIQAITHWVTWSKIKPSRISFEITETIVMRDFDQGCEALQVLKRLGVGISLDDFGTGYSSLSYVHRLPIDKIKIDRSFVTGIETSGNSRSIVTTVVSLCHNLGVDCIVEGVETEAQSDVLRELGCTTMQGYLFAKPMAEAAVLEHLASQRNSTRNTGFANVR